MRLFYEYRVFGRIKFAAQPVLPVQASETDSTDNQDMLAAQNFEVLEAYLNRVPAIKTIGKGVSDDGNWWVKFDIDVNHPLAWHVVQELGHVLNYLSVAEPLPTVFKPVSPPPYMNGGPDEFLSWVIEASSPKFTPAVCAEWLEGRLPRPVDDLSQWDTDE